MRIEKAQESLRAAEICFQEKLYNSTANRAYYAMFQAASVALERAGVSPKGYQWSHEQLQATFATELTRNRKIYPHQFASYLTDSLILRHQADYSDSPIVERKARKVLQWAQEMVRRIAGGAE